MTDRGRIDRFGIYIHWPFCQAKCPYCDFNAYVAERVEHDDWTSAYLEQLEVSSLESGDRDCASIYFGGGTPSLMKPEAVFDIIEQIRCCWKLKADAEITLECNPTSTEAGKLRLFKDAGVNRISLGVQSLKDSDLKALGRLHNSREARTAFDHASDHFDNVSIDLMFGRQRQGVHEWRSELSEALGWGASHLSLYQLTIEPETSFGRRLASGKLSGLPDADLSADLYLAAGELCEQAGYQRYEVSNYSRPGAQSRHNLLYWRYRDFLGIGPGAHGRLKAGNRRYAVETFRKPSDWLNSVRQTGSGESCRTLLCAKEQASEYLMMSLRLNEGASLDRFRRLSGEEPDKDTLERLISDGLVEFDGHRLKATCRGLLVLNSVISEMLRQVT